MEQGGRSRAGGAAGGAPSVNRFSRLALVMAGSVPDSPAEQHIHSCAAAADIISLWKGEAD